MMAQHGAAGATLFRISPTDEGTAPGAAADVPAELVAADDVDAGPVAVVAADRGVTGRMPAGAGPVAEDACL